MTEQKKIVLCDEGNLFLEQYINALRSAQTGSSKFTYALKEIGRIMMEEVIKRDVQHVEDKFPALSEDLEKPILTPGQFINQHFPMIKVLRAADPFCDGARDLIDGLSILYESYGRQLTRSVGIADCERLEDKKDLTDKLKTWEDITMNLKTTSWKIPKTSPESTIYVMDPMLASFTTSGYVLKRMYDERKEGKLPFDRIVFLSVFAANYAWQKMPEQFPEVDLMTCTVETGGVKGMLNGELTATGLDGKGFIRRFDDTYACGDCGDRGCNT